MSEEVAQVQEVSQAPPEGGGEQQAGQAQPDPAAALKAQIEKLTRQQESLVRQLAESPAETPEAPAPQPPPTPTGPRIKREDYDAMAEYAAQQAQEAMRLRLIALHELPADALQGVFDSPADMERAAQLLALEGTVTELKSQLEQAQTAPAEGGPEPPQVDTGGPSGTQPAGEADLEAQYQQALSLGRTAEARRRFLEARYRDPKHRSLVREQTT